MTTASLDTNMQINLSRQDFYKIASGVKEEQKDELIQAGVKKRKKKRKKRITAGESE